MKRRYKLETLSLNSQFFLSLTTTGWKISLRYVVEINENVRDVKDKLQQKFFKDSNKKNTPRNSILKRLKALVAAAKNEVK